MAQLVLGIGGGMMFGPIGFIAGSALGSLLDPQKVEGPRLKNLHLQGSEYGKMIPIVYGTMRVAGNIIWQTDLTEHTHTSGGKGGPNVTTYTYTASFAVKICEGPIVGIRRVWAAGTLIFDATPGGAVLDPIPMTIYLGTDDQLPDPTMESVIGVGHVPADRGYAKAVLTDWDLGPYGNMIPQLNFEVQQTGVSNSQIRVVALNTDDPQLYTKPFLSQWTLNSGPVRAVETTISNHHAPTTAVTSVYAYNQDLTGNGVGVVDPATDSYPRDLNLPHTAIPYVGVGIALNALERVPLWLNSGLPVTPLNQFPSLASTDLSDDDTTVYGADVAYAWGVPAGVYVRGAAINQDSSLLTLFTAPSASGATIDTWYRIGNGAVLATGTVSPALGTPFGYTSSVTGTPAIAAENDGMWFWVYRPNETGSGTMYVYSIDASGNFALNATCGSAPLNPAKGGGAGGSVRVLAQGYAGVVHNDGDIGIFTRYPSNALVSPPLSDIVANISARTGMLTPDQYDTSALIPRVDGYVIDRQSSARDVITQMQPVWQFDPVESGGVMKFVMRGATPLFTIPDDDLAAQASDSEAPALVEVTRSPEQDIPATLNVSYFDNTADYQIGTQYARRLVVQSQSVATLQLPVSMTPKLGNAVAWTDLTTAWIEREKYKVYLPRKYWNLEPTDVIVAHGYTMRLTHKLDTAPGVVQFDAVRTTTLQWIQGPVAAVAVGFSSSTPTALQPTNLLLLDIPLTADTDSGSGFYVAAAGAVDATWRGYTLFKSSDGGASYTQLVAASVASVIGAASTVLGNFYGGNIFDESNIVTVVIGAGGGELASADELAVLNGANLALLGDELIQFKLATLTAPNTYDLSGLLRGRRGTEWAMASHVAGERFVLLPVTNVDQSASELGQARIYKAVTQGDTLANSIAQSFTNMGAAARPYAPVQVAGAPITPFDGTVQINWVRRTRAGGAWVDYVDVPLSEASEGYVVQIWDSTFTQVARIIETTSPTVTYTAAQQVADFGETQLHVYATVGQKGAFLLGTQAKVVVIGLGAANDAPLAPLVPYNSAPPPSSGGCVLPVTSSTINWAAPASVFDAGAGPDGTWVISFTTPASPTAGLGSIAVTESGGPQVQRTATFALSPCGAPLTAGARVSGYTVTMFFYVDASTNPYPSIYPTLLPNTTYYFSVDSASASGAVCNLNHA
jgi:hypothetical protein